MSNEQILKMYNALRSISNDYQTPDQLRRNCEKQYGLDFEETITMAYENIQETARLAIKGVRIKSISKP